MTPNHRTLSRQPWPIRRLPRRRLRIREGFIRIREVRGGRGASRCCLDRIGRGLVFDGRALELGPGGGCGESYWGRHRVPCPLETRHTTTRRTLSQGITTDGSLRSSFHTFMIYFFIPGSLQVVVASSSRGLRVLRPTPPKSGRRHHYHYENLGPVGDALPRETEAGRHPSTWRPSNEGERTHGLTPGGFDRPRMRARDKARRIRPGPHGVPASSPPGWTRPEGDSVAAGLAAGASHHAASHRASLRRPREGRYRGSTRSPVSPCFRGRCLRGITPNPPSEPSFGPYTALRANKNPALLHGDQDRNRSPSPA